MGSLSLSALVAEYLSFPDDIHPSERRRLAVAAIKGAGTTGPIDLERVKAELHRRVNARSSARPRRHVLLATIAIPQDLLLRCHRFRDASITFPKRLSARFERARAEVVGANSVGIELPAGVTAGYRWAKVSVEARSDAEAYDHAMEVLNLLRGLWNLKLNSLTAWRVTFGSHRKPINTILLGPVQSIHSPSGELVRKIFWYDPSSVGAPAEPSLTDTKLLRDHLSAMLLFASNSRKRLRKLPYRSQVEAAIRLYNEALDRSDWSLSFLGLWQALEVATLVGGQEHANVVGRLASLCRDREFHSCFLTHLRSVRHAYVHSGRESTEPESNLYWLKSYADALLRFLLDTAGQFSSKETLVEFLDLPASDELDRRIGSFRRALSVRSVAGNWGT